MNSWSQTSFQRLLLPFIVGIISAVYFPLFINHISVLVSLLVLAASVIVLVPKLYLPYRQSWVFGVLIYASLFLLGYQITTIKTEIYSANHFANIDTHYELVHCKIAAPVVEKENSIKALVEIKGVYVDGKYMETKGGIISYFKKTPKSIRLTYGDEFVSKAMFKDVSPPQNPGEFNYKRYLSFQNINYQSYLTDKNWVYVNKNTANPVLKKALDLRDYLLSVFVKHKISGNEFAVGSALLLGYEDKLDAEIISSYSSTGALHVLSVSGLHVGIVFVVFNWLLLFFDKIKYGRTIKAVVLLLLLWFYATLTGLSPSVLRSAAMFSFIIIAKAFNKNTDIYTILSASAFFLLLINPYLIMEVGFQLSYLAVVGIVFIQPKIYNWLAFDNKIADAIWSISTVSIAAQIATFPLGLHYFHQFPNYFLFSNLIVIPLSTIVIYLGLSIFVFAKLSFVVGYLAMAFNGLVWLLNGSVKWMENLPFAIIEGVSITVLGTWLIYAIIVSFLYYFIKRKYNYLIFSLLITIGLLFYQVFEQHSQFKQQKIIVYNIPKISAIDFINGKQNVLFTDSLLATNESKLLFHVKHNWWNLGMDNLQIVTKNMENGFLKIENDIILFNDKRIKIINYDYKGMLKQEFPVPLDYIIVSGNPTITISEILKKHKPKKIIFDSSNSNYKVQKWILACKEINQEYYSVSESGAFVLDTNF